ncbi:MAG TPA: prolipoprotein diacylglyceryl transferase family protein [Candidatus Limnocylindrales bacterium]
MNWPLAFITLSFDPLLSLGPLSVRWQTIGVTLGLLLALAVAALFIPRTTAANERQLRLADLVLILVGIVPGAVVGGRLVHVLDFIGAYAANPISIVDPRVGSLSLLGAVVGGTLNAIYVVRLLNGPIARWADLGAVPLLVALGVGKLAQLLGGSGQGAPFDGPWAVAFSGNGPWVTFAPSLSAHPSQVYEGIWLLVGIPVILNLAGPRRVGSGVHPWVAWAVRSAPAGALFAGAVAWFLAGRVIVGFTWRDESVVGPLNMEQLLALMLLAAGAALLWLRSRRRTLSVLGTALCLLTTLACGGPTTTVQPTAPSGRPSPSVGASAPPSAPSGPIATATPPPTAGTIDTLISEMTTDEKIGQLFMVSFQGDQANETDPTQVQANEASLGVANVAAAIATYHLGGVIYFDLAGNMVSPRQVATLSNSIQALAAAQPDAIPLLISTDQEGGAIVRLPSPATQFPGNMALGATRQTSLARSTAAAIGAELRAEGLNQVLAPDGDVNINPANPVIGVRSFGSDATLVASMASAMVAGFQTDAGVAATVKHFPGHGDTNIDSHTALPTINHTSAQWASIDEPPFAAAINGDVDVVMVGHLAFPALDASGTPASLSAPIIGTYLRGQLGFKGVVITDALTMGALRDGYGDAGIAVKAVTAGDDILLMPQSLPVAFAAIQAAVANGTISNARLNQSVKRILQLKQRLGLFTAPPVSVSAATSVLSAKAHKAVETNDAHSAVTLIANDGNVLPLRDAAPDGPYLVVGPTSASTATVEAAIRTRGLVSNTYTAGIAPRASLISGAAAYAAGFGTVIVLTLDADTDTGQQKLVAALAATGKRLVTVSIDRPYDEAYYRAAVNLCVYSSSTASLLAATGVIFGDFAPTGQLPVGIPDPNSPATTLYPLGFGLTYP